MSRSKFPVRFHLQDQSGEVVRRGGIIRSPKGTYTFWGLSPGTYQASGKYSNGDEVESDFVKLTSPGRIRFYVSGGDFSGQYSPLGPPVKTIVSSATAATIVGNFGGFQPFLQSLSKQFFQTARPEIALSSKPVISAPRGVGTNFARSQAPYTPTFSTAVRSKLQECLRSYVENSLIEQFDIPTPSGLLESIVIRETNLDSEFEAQVVYLYETRQQFQSFMQDCDPTLITEILAARENLATSEREVLIEVTGYLVNVRREANDTSAVLAQIEFGSLLVVDQNIANTLSEIERVAIRQGRGWQPVLLSDGRSGYIYSLYARKFR